MLRRLILIPILVALLPQAAAQSATQLAEIIVTARLRAVDIQELPASVSVIKGNDLVNGAILHLEELLPQIPSLSWAGASSRPRFFQLRGVGELEQYQGAPNPSVGFLVDETDFSGIGMIASLFDVEQVEVLRGPQGTRYGGNALGGMIKLKTRDPAADQDIHAEAGAGEDGLWMAGLAAGGGLPSAAIPAAWRAVLHRAVSDGFRHNSYLGRDDTNGRDELSARLKFRLGPASGWQADLGLILADFNNGYDAFAIDNSFTTVSDRPGRDSQRSLGASLDTRYAGWSGLSLRSITAWAESDIEASFDADWGNDAGWAPAGPYDFFSSTLRERRTFSQDLRLMSTAAGDWSWLAGAWIAHLEELNHIADDGQYTDDAFVRVLDSRYRATSAAVYGEIQWSLTPATLVSAGLRLEERDARYGDSDGGRFKPRDRMWGGELSLTRQLSGSQWLWTSLSRGFKAGGFNIGAAVPADRRQFQPEYLWTLEFGWKGNSAGERQTGDVNLFYMRREHQQVATSLQLDPGDPLTFLFLTDNAARGEAWGLEASARHRATERFELASTLALMRSRYLDYDFGNRNLDGRAWAHAPAWKFSIAATWRHPAGWMARLDLSGEDGYYHDTSHDQRSDARLLTNLRAGFEAGHWSLHVWARNLFDERYPVRGFYFGNEPPDFPTTLYLRWGDPRQLGMTARVQF
ncbi:MAG: TonB-dependent receptor plug domain-containing protein [Steroidobacteraceae bacterium]